MIITYRNCMNIIPADRSWSLNMGETDGSCTLDVLVDGEKRFVLLDTDTLCGTHEGGCVTHEDAQHVFRHIMVVAAAAQKKKRDFLALDAILERCAKGDFRMPEDDTDTGKEREELDRYFRKRKFEASEGHHTGGEEKAEGGTAILCNHYGISFRCTIREDCVWGLRTEVGVSGIEVTLLMDGEWAGSVIEASYPEIREEDLERLSKIIHEDVVEYTRYAMEQKKQLLDYLGATVETIELWIEIAEKKGKGCRK